MSIEYLNLQRQLEGGKLLTAMMKKIGKDYLLTSANSQEVDNYKKKFMDCCKVGACALIEYLVKAGEVNFEEDANSNNTVTN